MRRLFPLALVAAILAVPACSDGADPIAQPPAAPASSPATSPKPSPVPTAVDGDPNGGKACAAIKPYWDPQASLDLAAVIAAAQLGMAAKDPSIKLQAGRVLDAATNRRSNPSGVSETDVRAWIDGFGQECLQRGYYGNV